MLFLPPLVSFFAKCTLGTFFLSSSVPQLHQGLVMLANTFHFPTAAALFQSK